MVRKKVLMLPFIRKRNHNKKKRQNRKAPTVVEAADPSIRQHGDNNNKEEQSSSHDDNDNDNNEIKMLQTVINPDTMAFATFRDRAEALEANRNKQRTDSQDNGLSEHQQQLMRTPVELFLSNFREHGSECISSAYLMDRQVRTSTVSGALSTSLPEDVFTLVQSQTSVIDEYLISSQILESETGDAVLVDGLLAIVRCLWHKQTHYRSSFLVNLESSIAAANDFLRMIEKVDDLVLNMAERYPHLVWHEAKGDSTTSLLRREASDLISLYGSDAVYAAQRVATFVVQAVQSSNIPDELFSRDWEDKFVHNEVAVAMVRTFEDYLSDIHNFIEHDFLYHKTVVALVRSTVCFYLRCFINKAEEVRHVKKKGRHLGAFTSGTSTQSGFMSTSRAICRMTYDIEVLRDYFYSVSKESSALGRVVANELSVLLVILECMWLAVGQTGADSLEEFIVVVHKRTGADSDVTKQFLSDVWLLIAPADQQHVIGETVKTMQSELQMVSQRMKETDAASPWKMKNNDTSYLRLDEMLRTMYEERNFQKQASICGNIIRDVKELRESRKEAKNPFPEMQEKLRGSFKLDHFRRFLREKGDKDTRYAGKAL